MKHWTTTRGTDIFKILGGRSNVFLISGERYKILVDTSPARKWPTLNKRLQNMGVEKLDYLILTHTHFDHAGNALKVKEHYRPRIVVHFSEASYLKNGDNIIPKGTNVVTRQMMKWIAPVFATWFRYAGIQADILVIDELELNDLGMKISIIHTPGHTHGCISIIVDGELALVGDAMFGVFPKSVFPPFATDVPEMIKSWNKLLGTGCSYYLPAHGIEIGTELLMSEYHRYSRLYP